MTEEPIRIARVITRLNVGGPAIQAMLLTSRLNAGPFRSLLLAGRPGPAEGDMAVIRPVPNAEPIYISDLRREISPVHDVRALIALIAAFRAFRPHVVHTHLAKAGALGRLASRIVGVPVVIHTFHGNVLSGYFGARTNTALTLVERVLARMSTRIVAISDGQRAELDRRGIGRRDTTVVIPLGFDLGPFREARPAGFRASVGAVGRPLVGIVARLVPIKRVDLFLRAARRVAVAIPDARFVVIGDGPLRRDLEVLADALGVSDRVAFAGWQADVAPVYADLDVLVCCSDNEGTPVSIIEAMAAGTAVVSTAVGGVPDIVHRGDGVLVPRGDDAGLADAIVALLGDDAARHDLAGRGRDRVSREHSVEALTARIEDLYLSLIAGRPAAPR